MDVGYGDRLSQLSQFKHRDNEQKKKQMKRVERERRSEIGSGVQPARERTCLRRNLSLTVKKVFFCFFSVAYHRTLCRSSGLEPSSKGGSPLGGKTRSRGGPWRENIGLHVQVVIPENGGYHRSGDAGFSPGGGGFLSFAAAGSSSREGEVFSAPSSPVLAPEGRGSHSSTMSVLIPGGRGSHSSTLSVLDP
ncbi:hypothetical protein YC2023_036878 [Brassica napus]